MTSHSTNPPPDSFQPAHRVTAAGRSTDGHWLWGLPFALLGSALVVRLWLTHPLLVGGLWPADIQRRVLTILGGSVGQTLAGEVDYELSITALMVRLVGLLGFGLLPTVIRHRRLLPQTARRLTATLLIPCGWWLLWLAGDIGSRFALELAVGSLPLCLTSVFGLLVFHLLDAAVTGAADGVTSDHLSPAVPANATGFQWTLAVVLLGVIGWTAVSFWMNARLYAELLIPHGDSAMYEEHLWNVWHGKGFRSYLDQGLFLGEHIQVIHLLLLPLHMIWPSHLLLELSESFALAVCAVPIYLGVRRRTGDGVAAMWLGLAWLFYYPMHFLDIAIDQKTFRPLSLGLPFLFAMIELTDRRRYVSAGICLLLALSAKEDVALICGPLLLVAGVSVWRTNRQWTRDAAIPVLMGVCSLLYLVMVVLVVIPWFRSGDVVHYSRYFGDLGNTPGELVKTAVADPLRVIRQAATAQTILYVLVFCVPLALLPCRRLFTLSAGLLTFGMLSLLQFGDASGLPPVPYHHFHAPLLVVIFYASSLALVRATPGDLPGSHSPSGSQGLTWRPRSCSRLVFLLCLCTGLTGSLMPWGVTFWSTESGFGYERLYASSDPQQRLRVAMVPVIDELIPADARVASTDFIHTRLTHRERSYDYSEYLRKVNDYQPGVPADTDFIVIDRLHRYSVYRNEQDVREIAQSDVWELLPDETQGAYFVLRRRRR